jgi:hypothetical protein
MFFLDFSSNLNRNKLAGRLECDYDDPVKSKMCPPITAFLLAPYGGSEEGEDVQHGSVRGDC